MATILIVEDRPIERKFLATLLGTAGHKVIQSADGAEALSLAASELPDLVISDILMPTVDGYELARRMRETPALAGIPVIFYTATYHEREAWSLARQCGVSEVLTKPSASATILAKVQALLQGRPAGAPAGDLSAFAEEHLQVVKSALSARVNDLEASEQRMAAIVSVAHQIAAERDTRAMFNRVCEAARDVTLAQQAMISLVTEDGRAFRRISAVGFDANVIAQMDPPPTTHPLARQLIVERRPFRVVNPSGRPEDLGFPASQGRLSSMLAVPIGSPTQVVGCLVLRNKLGADEFSARDEQVAIALATQAGIAYENSRLFDAARAHADELEAEIRERRRVESELRRSNERTGLALAAAKMGTWELDFSTRAVRWSDTMAAVFGLAPDRAPTNIDEFAALIHPDDRDSLQETMARAVKEGSDYQVEFRALWPDGSIHSVFGLAQIMAGPDGTPAGLLGVGMDVSDRKSLEAQFRQAQKMEAVGQLAGGVAHDFNNMLTAVNGYAGLLRDTFGPEDPRRQDIDEILNASNRAAALTRQLLAFSRKQLLEPQLIDLNQLVSDMSNMLGRLIGESIELTVTLSPAPAVVRADTGQIEQTVMNLVVNARDAMPDGGRLTIETAHVHLDQTYAAQHASVAPGDYVMLAVTDDGVGMTDDIRQRIFEPFFTTKARGHGTGLGLSTVYGIVNQSGGHIWVYSEPAMGTTFKIYLRAAGQQPALYRPVREEGHVPAGSEMILLVEDERAVRRLARTLLERAGYQVIDAATPQEAEVAFRERGGRVDLLLTDVVMPGIGGPELYRRLSAHDPGLRVVYMSGYPDDALTQSSLPEDMIFLQKPFTLSSLTCKVREALDR
jgi:PAS domain S-box-containing protein